MAHMILVKNVIKCTGGKFLVYNVVFYFWLIFVKRMRHRKTLLTNVFLKYF